jgi:hypothetical protein
MEYLYLIRSGDHVKIGISRNIKARLADLQVGNPVPLAIIATFAFADAGPVERAVHERFADARVRGEWFQLKEGDLEVLANFCRSCREAIVPTVRYFDLDSLPTEQVLKEQSLHIVPTLRAERRGDRSPAGFAFYRRGYPVYVSYLSERVVQTW